MFVLESGSSKGLRVYRYVLTHTYMKIRTHLFVCWRMTEINFIEWRLSLSQRYISSWLKRSMAIKVCMAWHTIIYLAVFSAKPIFSCICLYRSVPRLYGKIPSASHCWKKAPVRLLFWVWAVFARSIKTSSFWHSSKTIYSAFFSDQPQ